MPALGNIIERLTTSVDNAESWIEMVRDLRAPIQLEFPDIAFNIRWAEKADIVEIAALEGFVKEINVMTRSLRHGDRCILFEKMGLGVLVRDVDDRVVAAVVDARGGAFGEF